jgi:hypothetical protein
VLNPSVNAGGTVAGWGPPRFGHAIARRVLRAGHSASNDRSALVEPVLRVPDSREGCSNQGRRIAAQFTACLSPRSKQHAMRCVTSSAKRRRPLS